MNGSVYSGSFAPDGALVRAAAATWSESIGVSPAVLVMGFPFCGDCMRHCSSSFLVVPGRSALLRTRPFGRPLAVVERGRGRLFAPSAPSWLPPSWLFCRPVNAPGGRSIDLAVVLPGKLVHEGNASRGDLVGDEALSLWPPQAFPARAPQNVDHRLEPHPRTAGWVFMANRSCSRVEDSSCQAERP